MTTSVGMNQSDTVGMNKSTSVTMNITETAGANIWQNATLDYSLNATNIMKIASENYTYEANDIHKNAADGAAGYTSTGSHVIYPSSDNVKCKELTKDIFSTYNVVSVENTSPKIDVRGL